MGYTIYCATCKVNNKSYVGQSINFKNRKKNHISCNKNRSAFQNAILKYGSDNFNWIEIESELTLDEANEAEEFYIAYLNTIAPNGYNIKHGGNNHTPSVEMRKRISDKLKITGSFVGKKGKDHPNFGRKLTAEHKQKVSNANAGENGPLTKLTNVLVEELYRKALAGTTTNILMKEYDLGRSAISNILTRKCWINVTANLPDINTNERISGEAAASSKLTKIQVIEIIAKAKLIIGSKNNKCNILSDQYNVSPHCIYDILSGSRWKHIPR